MSTLSVPARRVQASAPSFAHLARMTDDTGLFEHARYATARRGHGYCTDDVARGLVVVCREPAGDPELARLTEVYLAFLSHAQDAEGAFHNRLGYDRRWADEAGTGDWWGRALWGLGTAAARSPASWIRDEALAGFRRGARLRSTAPHALAFAGLGAAEVLRAYPADPVARDLLIDAAAGVGRPGADPAWCWPYPYLSYASAALAEVVIVAGRLRGEAALRDDGLRMLSWLRGVQQIGGRLSVIPVGGWQQGAPRHRYDQQPIEVAAYADACATAADATGDLRWHEGVRQAVDWFHGANDGSVVMTDQDTGGGYDGLTPDGPNANQGAESTLALLSTLQHARDLAAADR